MYDDILGKPEPKKSENPCIDEDLELSGLGEAPEVKLAEPEKTKRESGNKPATAVQGSTAVSNPNPTPDPNVKTPDPDFDDDEQEETEVDDMWDVDDLDEDDCGCDGSCDGCDKDNDPSI